MGRKSPKTHQRRGLPPPCGIHPAFPCCEELLSKPGRRAVTMPGRKWCSPPLHSCWGVLRSPVFGPTCGAPRPTAAGRRPLPPGLRAWWGAAVPCCGLPGFRRLGTAATARERPGQGNYPGSRASCHGGLGWWHNQEQQEMFRAVDMGRNASQLFKGGT